MKKLLALVLALVMVMGLATVGTSAAKYSDDADINYDEAVAVMSSIGVLEGADGKFRPAAELKRSEAAKIVAYLYYNNKTAAGLIGVGKFNDVPTNHWAAGYVDTLANAGVIAGRGNGAFDPDGDLKAIDFAKMLLVCIGYDPKLEGLVGSDYAINTSKLANSAGLFKGMSNLKANDVLTREQAAQMAFNTVKAATVEYANKGGEISLNGATVSLGASNATYVTTTLAKEQRISDRKLTNTGLNTTGGYTVEFGERQYPDLRLIETTDDFGRPASEWVYGKETVGKFVNQDLLMGSFTTAVTGADLFNLIGEAKIKNSENIKYFVNGRDYTYVSTTVNQGGVGRANMTRSNKVPYPYTGNGVLTEVYEKDEDLFIVSILTYYAEAAGDYNARTGKLNIDEQSWNAINGSVAPVDLAGTVDSFASAENFPEITKYKNDDPLLVRWAYKDGKYQVAEISSPKSDAGLTLSKYSTGTEKLNDQLAFYTGYVVTGGTQKNYSKTVKLKEKMQSYDNDALDTTYTLYYDQYENVIFAKPASEKTQYVFISGIDKTTSNLGQTVADAFAIFTDGTSAKIKVNITKTDEKIGDYQTLYRTGVYGDSAKGYWEKKDWNFSNYTKAKADQSVWYEKFSAATNGRVFDYNRWFNYSVSGEGANAVYTLSPCPNSLVVTATNNVDTAVKRQNQRTTAGLFQISTKSPQVVGDYYSWTKGATPAHFSAVGNDKSTYITVNTAPVSAGGASDLTGNTVQRGIAEVTGVFTGIQSVKITEYPTYVPTDSVSKQKKENPFNEAAWAVYDKNGFLVSTVVVGSDGGNSDNYVYALSEAKSESKSGNANLWDFEAIVNGEYKVMSVRKEYTDTIAKIKDAMEFKGNGNLGAMFSMSIDKDGYVTDATQVNFSGKETDVYNNYQVYEMEDTLEFTHTNSTYSKAYGDEKVYNTYFRETDTSDIQTKNYYFSGNTLYHHIKAAVARGTDPGVEAYATDRGLTIAPGAKIWVVQQAKVASSSQIITVYQDYTNFKDALNATQMSLNNGIYTPKNTEDSGIINGYVSAALDGNGTAKWVVIKAVGEQTDTIVHTYTIDNNSGYSESPAKSITIETAYTNAAGTTIKLTGFANQQITLVVSKYSSAKDATDANYATLTLKPDKNAVTVKVGTAGQGATGAGDLLIPTYGTGDILTITVKDENLALRLPTTP